MHQTVYFSFSSDPQSVRNYTNLQPWMNGDSVVGVADVQPKRAQGKEGEASWRP